MSQAIATQGTQIQRGDGATTEAFTKIAEVKNFSVDDGGDSEIDVSSLDSTGKEFRLGLRDGGSITFDCLLVTGDAAQEGLRSDRVSGAVRNFKIILPDTANTTLIFAALVTKFAISGGVDDVVSASVTLRVTGAVTWS